MENIIGDLLDRYEMLIEFLTKNYTLVKEEVNILSGDSAIRKGVRFKFVDSNNEIVWTRDIEKQLIDFFSFGKELTLGLFYHWAETQGLYKGTEEWDLAHSEVKLKHSIDKPITLTTRYRCDAVDRVGNNVAVSHELFEEITYNYIMEIGTDEAMRALSGVKSEYELVNAMNNLGFEYYIRHDGGFERHVMFTETEDAFNKRRLNEINYQHNISLLEKERENLLKERKEIEDKIREQQRNSNNTEWTYRI